MINALYNTNSNIRLLKVCFVLVLKLKITIEMTEIQNYLFYRMNQTRLNNLVATQKSQRAKYFEAQQFDNLQHLA